VVGANQCQPKIVTRRDYPLHPALGQAQPAFWQQQIAPPPAEWVIDCMVYTLPEWRIRRKVKLHQPAGPNMRTD